MSLGNKFGVCRTGWVLIILRNPEATLVGFITWEVGVHAHRELGGRRSAYFPESASHVPSHCDVEKRAGTRHRKMGHLMRGNPAEAATDPRRSIIKCALVCSQIFPTSDGSLPMTGRGVAGCDEGLPGTRSCHRWGGRYLRYSWRGAGALGEAAPASRYQVLGRCIASAARRPQYVPLRALHLLPLSGRRTYLAPGSRFESMLWS